MVVCVKAYRLASARARPSCRACGQGVEPAVRAGVVFVEFHPDIVGARDQQAVRFKLAGAEPAGVEAAALTSLARPAHATWFACGLYISEVLLSRRYPERFLVSALAPKCLILLARPKRFELLTPRFVVC